MKILPIRGISAAAILFAIRVPNRSAATPETQSISNAIKESAAAFFARQNKIIAMRTIADGALTSVIY